MKTLLIGNGINIQYGGKRFLNREIIKRAITSPDDVDFPLEAITLTDPMQPLWLIGTLFSMIPDVIEGEYDHLLHTDFENDALKSFKNRYGDPKKRISHLDIGMEDYFFLLEIFFKVNGINQRNAYAIREGLKRIFAYAVYSKGALESIHQDYPLTLRAFFDQFDSIYTTNYDSNLESFTKQSVEHLHGCFKTLSYVYDENSFRNQLSDSPIRSALFDAEHSYLFSTAIFSYSGALKELEMAQAVRANTALDNFAIDYETSESVKSIVEELSRNANWIIQNLAEAIRLKGKDPSLLFEDYYSFNKFQSLEGAVSIVGLSPNNDTHIFNFLKSNEDISEITYFYHSLAEGKDAKKLLGSDKLILIDVHDLWSEYE